MTKTLDRLIPLVEAEASEAVAVVGFSLGAQLHRYRWTEYTY